MITKPAVLPSSPLVFFYNVNNENMVMFSVPIYFILLHVHVPSEKFTSFSSFTDAGKSTIGGHVM